MREEILKQLKKKIKAHPEMAFENYLENKLEDRVFAKGFAEEKIKLRIAMEIYRQRQKAKMPLTKLEKITGISQENIAKIENGKSLPSIRTLDKIAAGFNKELELSFG